jgi:hypothetical protein
MHKLEISVTANNIRGISLTTQVQVMREPQRMGSPELQTQSYQRWRQFKDVVTSDVPKSIFNYWHQKCEALKMGKYAGKCWEVSHSPIICPMQAHYSISCYHSGFHALRGTEKIVDVGSKEKIANFDEHIPWSHLQVTIDSSHAHQAENIQNY